MQHFETIIIGAGPGGLACAATLAARGREVLVLEKKKTIGAKICAGGLTWAGLHSRNVPDHLIERSFSEQFVFSNWQKTEIRSQNPIIATINRQTLGQWMKHKAREAGAVIIAGSPVREISDTAVFTTDRQYTFDYLVGADGSGSMTRRYLGLPAELVGSGLHYQVDGDFPRMEWHLNTALFGNGYAWIFPHRGSASVGVYACRRHNRPRDLLEHFHIWLQEQGIDVSGTQLSAATINFDYRGWNFGRFFLVGEAAGLASGLTGEGILPAIVSGETVAMTIIDKNYQSGKLECLLRKHRRHAKIVHLSAANKAVCTWVMESLVLALRSGFIHFSALEMGKS